MLSWCPCNRKMFFEVPDWKLPELAVKGKSRSPGSNRTVSVKKSAKRNRKRGSRVVDDSVAPGGPALEARVKPLIPQVRVALEDVNPGGRGPKKMTKEEVKLAGARFRALSQRLYEIPSRAAVAYFQEDPSEFSHYHVGFRAQTQAWPVNPVDLFISKIRSLLSVDQSEDGLPMSPSAAQESSKAKRSKNAVLGARAPAKHVRSINIADIGCGEAKIASELASLAQQVTVHSFDLVAVNDKVTVANMADLPLPAGSTDFAVFCLSLMNTDYGDALGEAHRILKAGSGALWVAEVSSRFQGGALEDFKSSLRSVGFRVQTVDTKNTHFFIIEATKVSVGASENKAAVSFPPLRPCLYKRR